MSGAPPPQRTALIAGTFSLLVIVGVGLSVWSPWDREGETQDPASTSTTVVEAEDDGQTEVEQELIVTNTDDAGPDSLRQAIEDANSRGGRTVIRFDSVVGPFADPQVITLESPLPAITGDLVIDGYIDDRLFVATGVTVSGADQFRVLTVAEGATVILDSLTIANGAADNGAGVLNRGALVLKSSTLMDNVASDSGGALANDGGEVTVINSTFTLNRAGTGGGLAHLDGRATVINSTFSENSAERGGALFSDAEIVVSNTILANSATGADCVSTGEFDAASTNNLIEENDGCGDPISMADPNLEGLNYYNGPAQTLPLRSGSPAINLGSNEAAVDENGDPLVWDQRGNGDPRFVAGYTDIGAFEHQAFPDFTVDTTEDVALRGCTKAGQGDCPLRAAIELANATPEPDVIVFDPRVFAEPATITLTESLPEVTSDLTLEGSQTPLVTIEGGGLRAAPGIDLRLIDVETR